MRAFRYDSIDSTNEAAKRLIAEKAIDDRAFVLAREQTAGKGTRGRQWLSPRDAGIYLSLIHMAGPIGFPASTAYAMSAGIACTRVLESATSLPVQIKPVNDLWVANRKLGGILIETIMQGNRIQALITGIGINIRRAARPLPPHCTAPVCLAELLAPAELARVDESVLVDRLVAEVHHWHRLLMEGDCSGVEQEWRKRWVPGSSLP